MIQDLNGYRLLFVKFQGLSKKCRDTFHSDTMLFFCIEGISHIENQRGREKLPGPSYYNDHLSLNTSYLTPFFVLEHVHDHHHSFEKDVHYTPHAHDDLGFEANKVIDVEDTKDLK